MSSNEEPPDVTGAFSALVAGFRLTRKEQALLLRVLWVLFVSAHIAWVCGFLGFIGLASPFARADDVTEIKQASKASARVTLSQEIRAQAKVRCGVTDQAVYDSLTRYIEGLQFDYERIAGQRYPEPECPRQ